MILRRVIDHFRKQEWPHAGRHPVRGAAIYRCGADTGSGSFLRREIPDQRRSIACCVASGMTFPWVSAA